MLDEAERRYRSGEILRLIAGDLGVNRPGSDRDLVQATSATEATLSR
ncbi:hypothetical protein Gbro_3429 [Gordonia bronchialis DSM 43247]|uniref:Uncharacterized protein n=1 Tax=Gordonia bronchialis (strain ATCC 25592 / DSM 43247 / BCRC 13721 / JCM 3198 / KCTC 3076 / NBRC 16047 / NCTC 10667) TaxID=526226 RepID=D0LE32_GORB4|nr:hypothetical protein Gbro_3429 [Gordonia bronchialis DSM 43247]